MITNHAVFTELLRRARACDRCGKPHRLRLVGNGPVPKSTWADPDDGHDYAGYTEAQRDFAKIARAAAGSSRDTTPKPLKVKLYTHWLPFSVAAENQPFTDGQRQALAGHEDHETAGNWSAFGWRELRCVSCDVTVWSVTTQEEGR